MVEPMLPSMEPPLSPKKQHPNRRSRQSKLTNFLMQRPPRRQAAIARKMRASVSKIEKQFELRNGCEEGSTLEVEKVTGIAENAK